MVEIAIVFSQTNNMNITWEPLGEPILDLHSKNL